MENLSKIAKGIFLGNGEVWNFLDYAVNRECGGLMAYTRKNNFLSGKNLINNFKSDDGKPRYSRSDTKNTGKYYGIDRVNGNITEDGLNGIGDDIGVFYKIPKEINRGLKFITNTEFENLNEHILSENIKKLYFTGGTEFKGFGDRRIVPSKEEVFKSISKAKKTPPLRWKDITYEYTTKFPYKEESRTSGIYEIYEPERLLPIEDEINKHKNKWSHKDSYGVEFNERGQEYYSINEENKYEGDVQISKHNGGTQSQFDSKSNARTYNYYEEKEGKEPSIIKTSTIDGSVVSLSDYNNSSRLLQKTNELFRQGKINSLINRFHTDNRNVGNELTTAYDDKFGISRGRNLIKGGYEGKDSGDKSTGYDNPYCRTWTAHYQYSKLKDRIRPFIDENSEQPKTIEDTQSNYGYLRTTEGAYNLTEYSVLRSDGFVRITPTHKDGKWLKTPQNYMFSIENLAWRDANKSLSPEQKGPNGGRIMWFPPYNLKFTENVNVNWNANTFIGRGEEIYTYTNTVRTGTLDFTLLIDHPSILNKWRGTSSDIDEKEEKERDLLRFFAGCGDLNDAVEPTKPKTGTGGDETGELPKVDPKPVYYTKNIAYVIFFPNNYSGYDYLQKGGKIDEAIAELRRYNNGDSSKEKDKSFASQTVKDYNKESEGLKTSGLDSEIKQTLFAGDDSIDEIHYFNDLEDLGSQITGDKIFEHSAQNCEVLNIETKGFASSHGYSGLNKTLCDRRRTFIEKFINEKAPYLKTEWTEKEGSIIEVSDIGNNQYVNARDAKLARAAYAIIKIRWKEDNKTGDENLSSDVTKTLNGVSFSDNNREVSEDINAAAKQSNVQVSKEILDEEYTYDNEYLYFSEVMGDALVHKHIVDKVRFFDPAFHSITPEGFNARLTFLQQCTRQGPTNAVSSGRVKADGSDDYLKFAGNLAFGRAPYCILRVGDFFHTKICIDSMSITYDNNGVQWDLNPEGIGVQPMYANISLSFKFLGGQDLVKPIERLQNAVTANYYANASVYSRHADTNKYYYDALEGDEINKK